MHDGWSLGYLSACSQLYSGHYVLLKGCSKAARRKLPLGFILAVGRSLKGKSWAFQGKEVSWDEEKCLLGHGVVWVLITGRKKVHTTKETFIVKVNILERRIIGNPKGRICFISDAKDSETKNFFHTDKGDRERFICKLMDFYSFSVWISLQGRN